jgi:hypothetical protein
MLQQVQARYGLKAPVRIAYWDGKRLRSVSEAVVLDLPRTRRQLYVEYPGGLKLWLNDHPTEAWTVRPGGREATLPPAGWAAYAPKGEEGGALLSFSALNGSTKADYLRSGTYAYLDGRGTWFSVPEGGSSGALAISPIARDRLRVIHIAGDEPFVIRRPYGVRGKAERCEAYDVEGKRLDDPVLHDDGKESRIEPVKGAVRYEIAFSRKERP